MPTKTNAKYFLLLPLISKQKRLFKTKTWPFRRSDRFQMEEEDLPFSYFAHYEFGREAPRPN
jgi:hypothetical protein